MYIRTWWSYLGMLMMSCGLISGICVLAGHLSSIYQEYGTRCSTLKVDGQACKTFRACRATAANVQPNNEQSIS